jgi:hypothetical protein
MKWRCEWCGKPHEENDPPCDNCGHGTFEEAVVRQTDLSEEEGPESTTVWVCPECGRAHPKHNPPCSRCGHPSLEKEVQRVDESELSPPGYLDLVTPRYVVGLVIVLGLAVVFLLGVTGVVHIPGLSSGVPDVSNVPGDAETANGLSLSAAEDAYVAELNEVRAENGDAALTRDERLTEIAAFYNQRRVKATYGDGSLPSRERMRSLLSDSCQGQILQITPTLDVNGYGSGDAIGLAFAEQTLSQGDTTDAQTKTGVDMHVAPDGTIYLTQFAC